MKKPIQNSLFEEVINTNIEKKEIVIVPKAKIPLSKEQDRFNKITSRIQKLEKQLIAKEKSLEFVLDYFSKKIDPLIENEANNKVKAAFLLEEKLLVSKLSKQVKDKAEELIYILLDDAFTEIEPNKEEEELYNRYSNISYQEEKADQMNDMKAEFESMFSSMYGVDIDLDGINLEDENEVARLQRELQDKLAEQQASNFHEDETGSEKKKTKKQLEKELLEKVKIEAQSKSLKSIYISLTKVLHPDTETDPILKMEKEELMKKVTVAYQEKNFPLLLKLEMEWVHKTEEHLSQLSDDKLQVYISILLDRERELNSEKYMLQRHPRFEKISELAHMAEKSALREIEKCKQSLMHEHKLFSANLVNLENITTKKDISNFINDFHKDLVVSRYEDDFMDDFEDFFKNGF